MIVVPAGWGRRSSEPSTRTPVESVRTPGLRISVEGLYVDVDRGTWRKDMCFIAQSEALGMEARCLWDEDYGAIET